MTSAVMFVLGLMLAGLVGILAILILVPPPAHAQMLCGRRAEIVESIARKYHEAPHAFGLAGDSALVELFVSATGSWTMIVTRPTGVACIMAVGNGWETLPQQTKGESL